MTVIDALIILLFVALVGGLIYYLVRNQFGWKPVLIALVIAFCGLMLWYPGRYQPDTRLKKGLDLAGGTTMIYSVRVPDTVDDPQQAIDDLIAVLRDRVDPTGTASMVWRQLGGNRLQIQVPLAGEETEALREAYTAAREQLLEDNISPHEIDALLAADDARQQVRIQEIAQGQQQLEQVLSDLAAAADAREAAREAYNQARQQADEDTTGDAQETLLQATAAYSDARRQYEQALDALDAYNVSEAELERVLNMVATPTGPEGVSPRQAGFEELTQQHPLRAEQIARVARASDAYEEVKGTLEDPNDLITLLQASGILEFRIAASTQGQADVAAARQRLEEEGPRAGINEPYRWFEIDELEQFAETPEEREDARTRTAEFFRNRGLVGAEYGGRYYLLLANTREKSITRANADWELTDVGASRDQQGFPAVAFELNPMGASLMGQLTRAHVGQPMAILLDGQVISAPRINTAISGSGIIEGRFTQQELDYLIRTLNAGAAPVELADYPESIKTTGPTLGQDNLDRGLTAAIVGLVLVAGFMIVYYFFPGAVAVFALLANMVIILGVMAMIEAAWTLPGIAGVVLTIGMAVDANVLIFERIREELDRQADLGTAIRLGFDKAFSTILDANVTTLITCIVLGYTATAEVKGFAVTLGIGILATLFTSLFGSRVLIEAYLRWGRTRSMPMLPTILPVLRKLLSPNVDWVGKRYGFFTISVIVVGVSLALVATRGADMLDIEFRSGTQVSFDLRGDEMMSLDEARDRFEAYATAGELALSGQQVDEQDYRRIGELLAPEGAADSAAIAEGRQAVQQVAAILEDVLESPPADMPEAREEAIDFDDLRPANATLVTVGDTEDSRAAGFSYATLVPNARLVERIVLTAFEDVLEKQQAVNFVGEDVEMVERAPVQPIDSSDLADVINRSLTEPADIDDYVGGVAITLENMSPGQTPAEIEDRIQTMRSQPTFQNLGLVQTAVVGLELADEQPEDPAAPRRFSAAAVLISSPDWNYLENPDTFGETGGLADMSWDLVRTALQREESLDSVSNFSSQVSATMQQQAISALSLALLAVVVYIWLRFTDLGTGILASAAMVGTSLISAGLGLVIGQLTGQPLVGWGIAGGIILAFLIGMMIFVPRLRYGPAAIFALVHDVSIALGLIAITGWIGQTALGQTLLIDPFRLNLALIAAILTIIGYSLNDTIIVFDRIRENRGRLARATPAIINDSINQTISRTIVTSGTTFLAVLVLYIFGGIGIRGFAFTMLAGVIVGTYSSIAIAAPLLMLGRGEGETVPAPVKEGHQGEAAPTTA
ncbi:MAG: protein translocase subunit SecD [Phycisphaeraceae bacterium]